MRTIQDRKLVIRKPVPQDVEQLVEMIQCSTCGKSKATIGSLHQDLFGYSEKIKQFSQDDNVHELLSNHSLEYSNKPVCQSFVAQNSSNLIGYVMYHYYYSPWDGHEMFVDDIYVVKDFRKRGVARELMQEVFRVCTVENMKALLFNAANLDANLMATIKRYREAKSIRDEGSDWSVYRINFRNWNI